MGETLNETLSDGVNVTYTSAAIGATVIRPLYIATRAGVSILPGCTKRDVRRALAAHRQIVKGRKPRRPASKEKAR